jgi:hypothetical protein
MPMCMKFDVARRSYARTSGIEFDQNQSKILRLMTRYKICLLMTSNF